MIDRAMPARPPGPVPLPRRWSVGAARDRRRAGRQRRPHPRDVAAPRRARPALDARRSADRDRPADRRCSGPTWRCSSSCSCHAARGWTRSSAWTASRSPIAGSGSRRSGCSSAMACSSTVGYALGDRTGVVDEFVTLITTYPYVLMALVSGVLFAAVAISSMRAARRAAVVRDVVRHPPVRLPGDRARLPPPAVRRHRLHARPAGGRLLGRCCTSSRSRSSSCSVSASPCGCPPAIGCACRASSHEGPDVVSIYMTGRDLDQLAVRSGQYFVWRFLTRDGWWRGHPVLDLVGTQRILAADHDQGARRLVRLAGPRAGRDARLRRGSVRRPDRRPPDAAQGPARRGRDRDHAAAGPARGAARQAG